MLRLKRAYERVVTFGNENDDLIGLPDSGSFELALVSV